jgi:hypothetical protein
MRIQNRYNQDDRINYYRDKNTYCEHLKLSNKIKNITPQKIIKELGLHPTEDINYSEHLYYRVKEFRNKRRKRSIEIRSNKKNDNKELVRKYLIKNYTKVKMSDLLGVSRRQIHYYIKEIELEDKNKVENNCFIYFKSCITQYNNIIKTIKEIGYQNLPNYLKGRLNHIKSLGINKSNIKLFYNISLNLQTSHFLETYDITELEKQLKFLMSEQQFHTQLYGEELDSDNIIITSIKKVKQELEIGHIWENFLNKYKNK